MTELKVVKGNPEEVVDTRLRAVVAGDSRSAVEDTIALLERCGYRATAAHGVVDVLNQVTSGHPADLLVFDLGIDAWIYVVLLEVLAREGCPVPVVVVSDRRHDYRSSLERVDAPVVLKRPLDEARLSAILERVRAARERDAAQDAASGAGADQSEGGGR